MPFGDSITRGDGAHNTYRRPLWFKLQNAGYRVNFVGDYSDNSGLPPPNPDFDLDNQAVSGIRADQWLPFTDVAARHRAQRVLLYLGYNDLYNSQTAESTYTDIGQLIDALRGAVPSVVVFVAKPYLPTDPTLSSRVQTFNNGLPAFIASKTTAQSPVIMVDHTNVNAATETYDGLHPNDVGDAKLADNWFAALAPYLQ
jgi:lysophospholipase L1-like esterase